MLPEISKLPASQFEPAAVYAALHITLRLRWKQPYANSHNAEFREIVTLYAGPFCVGEVQPMPASYRPPFGERYHAQLRYADGGQFPASASFHEKHAAMVWVEQQIRKLQADQFQPEAKP